MDRLARLREEIKKLLNDREQHQDQLDAVLAGAEGRGEDSLTEAEQTEFNEHRDAVKTLDSRRKLLEERVHDIEETQEARSAAEASAQRFGGTATTSVRVNAEEPIYRKKGQHSFFRDMYAQKYNADPLAHDRLLAHARANAIAEREERATTTTSFAGLVVPQYLVDEFAPVARQGRPFINFVGSRELPPDGMTFNVPVGKTGTIVASQTGQNATVTAQDMVNQDIVVPVRTIAGQQDVSRQALDRGRNTDEEVMSDLAEAYAAELDRQAIHGTGSNEQHLGILSTTDVGTITVASSVARVQLQFIADGLQQVHSQRFQAAQVIVVHPRRWGYWCNAVDSNGRPLIVPTGNGPFNAFSVGDLAEAKGLVGAIYGVPVLVDPNIPTTITHVSQGGTDVVIVTRASDLRLYEDDPMPRRVRFEETLAGNLTVKIVAWDYTAWTAGRYPSASKVLSGTGFAAPVFGT
jgi:HK97 family phage major capsid protein